MPIRPSQVPSQVRGLRARNRRAIMTAIRNLKHTARVDIARVTGISAATVTSITADLVAEGLVEETLDGAQERSGGRGRPRVLLRVRPDAFLIAGAKISTDRITVTLTDYAGEEVAYHVEPQPVPQVATAVEVARHLCLAIETALAGKGKSLAELASVGVGLPGFIDASSGRVYWSACFKERDVDFRALLTSTFGCPVSLDNDANLVALAEKWFGLGRGVDNFIVVTIEHGVGMGVVLGGKLFRGMRGIGTEFGHTKVQMDGALCRCGQRGCLEAYVADYALVREAGAALGRDLSCPMTLQEDLDALFAAAKAGDRVAESIFERAGRMFAMGLANLVNVFDPNLIIFSGEQMRYDYLYSPRVLVRMRQLTVVPGRNPPEVRIHKWGDRIWVRGAAALAMDALAESDASGSARDHEHLTPASESLLA
jgi:transcriptional regulator of PTS gene